MGEQQPEPVPDLPYERQRVGFAVGQALIGLLALLVVLVDSADPVRDLSLFGFAVPLYVVVVGLSRLFPRGSVVPDAGIRRAAGPEHPDRRRAFSMGLIHATVLMGTMSLVMGLLFRALDSLATLPVILLGLAGLTALEARDLRRWETECGLTLYTRVGSRGLRPTVPKESHKLVSVPRERDALATSQDRS